ncbi:MAG: hypothetical protein WA996_05465, partial [Candidatus Promineifilaceae bacterium]
RYIPVWAGNDETSGVASYNVDYWGEGDVTITRWLSDSTDTSAVFTPSDNRIYWFISQAKDLAGWVELEHTSGDISTGRAVQLTRVAFLPLIFR